MKRLLTFAAVLALILSSAAFGSAGEVHDFGRFTLEVPKGWTASQTGDTGVVTRDDNMAQVTVMITNAEGNSLKDIAEYEARAYHIRSRVSRMLLSLRKIPTAVTHSRQ